jgi:hypothetical protein
MVTNCRSLTRCIRELYTMLLMSEHIFIGASCLFCEFGVDVGRVMYCIKETVYDKLFVLCGTQSSQSGRYESIFWNIVPCSPYVSRRFGRSYHLHLQGRKSAEKETSVTNHLLHVGLLFGWFYTLKMKAKRSETSVHIQTIRYYIPEDDNIQLLVLGICGRWC